MNNGDRTRESEQGVVLLRGFRVAPQTYLFVQLYVAIFVAVVNGSIFCFGLISPALAQAPFNFSTREINVVSTVGVIASYASLPTGLLYDRTSPRVTLLAGSAINVLGWMLMYGVFSGSMGSSTATVAACYFVSQLAASFFETGSVLPTLDAFSLHEGRVVVVQKTFMGLGASVMAAVYNAFFIGRDLRWFFLFLCVLSGTLGSLAAMIVRRPQQYPELVVHGINSGDPRGAAAALFAPPFRAAYCVLAATIIFVFAIDIYEAEREATPSARAAFGYIAIVLVLLFGQMLLFLPTQERLNEATDNTAAVSLGGTIGSGGAPAAALVDRNPFGLIANLRLPVLWLMWMTCFGSWGAMTLVNANSSQIYKAVVGPAKYDAARNGVFVSLFGLGSALGRVIAGFTKELVLQPRGIEVWYMFPAAPVIMFIALPLFFLLPGDYLFVPFTLVGIATGVTWGSTVLVIKRMFTQSGAHYAFLYTAGMVTPLFFNLWLFSSTYESESRKQHQPTLSDCEGTDCIMMPMLVACGTNVIAAAAAVVFVRFCQAGKFNATRAFQPVVE